MDPKEVDRNPNLDYGDELPEEQKSEVQEGKLSDDEVEAAISAMAETKGKTSPENTKDVKDEKSEGEQEESRIPKARFDEAIQTERKKAEALEKELKKLQARMTQQAAPPKSTEPTIDDQIKNTATKVRETREAWQTALLNNDQAEAKALLDELNQVEEDLDQLRIERASQLTRKAATEDVSFDSRLTQLEKEFPQINQQDDSYDSELDAKMSRLYSGLVRGGSSRIDALNEAAQIYLEPLRKAETKETKEETKEEIDDKLRTKKARETLKETIEKQPPEAEGKVETKGLDLKPSKMTMSQFAKLSEEQKAMLRGDYV